MEIQILGPSCVNCLRLHLTVIETLAELDLREVHVERITPPELDQELTGDPSGLLINGQLVWAGGNNLPKKTQIAEWIREIVTTTV